MCGYCKMHIKWKPINEYVSYVIKMLRTKFILFLIVYYFMKNVAKLYILHDM